MTADVQCYTSNLEIFEPAQDYLIKERGFYDLDFLIEDFSVGCSSREDDFFNGYITLPVWSDEGLETITSRTFNGKNPPHKHRNGRIEFFYNHEIIFEENEIVIVESPLCALSLEYIGIPAVASLGTGKLPDFYNDFDQDHVLTIIPDADLNNAGVQGANRIAKKLYPLVREIRIAELPLPRGIHKLDINDLFKRDQSDNKTTFSRQLNSIIKNAKVYVPKIEPERVRHERTRDLTEWKDRFNIVDVVSDFVELERAGSTFQGLCPFHNDRATPSFTVYPETNSFYCFSGLCDKAGDVIDFIRFIRNCEFKEAKEYLELYY